MKLNPEKDIEVDINDLNKEFRTIGPMIYRYSKEKSEAQSDLEAAEADLKELRSQLYLNLCRDNTDMKEAQKKAAIDQHLEVKGLTREVIELKKEVETIRGFVDGLKAKKDMLVQLGADARKE